MTEKNYSVDLGIITYDMKKEAKTPKGKSISPYSIDGDPHIGVDPNYIIIEHPSTPKGKLKEWITRIFYPRKGILYIIPPSDYSDWTLSESETKDAEINEAIIAVFTEFARIWVEKQIADGMNFIFNRIDLCATCRRFEDIIYCNHCLEDFQKTGQKSYYLRPIQERGKSCQFNCSC